MSKNITLRELIYQLRTEISNDISDNSYPIFLVESAEIEVVLDVTKTAEGKLEIGILDVVNIGGNATRTSGRSHSIKLKLVPIIPIEEFRKNLEKDTRLMEKVYDASRRSLHKGADELFAKPSSE